MKRFTHALLISCFLFPVSWLVAQENQLAVTVDAGDTQALITAIENANNGTGPDLIFVRTVAGGDNTFTFTMPYQGTDAALPPITRTIEIFPIDSLLPRITFERDINAPQFRLANVMDGGNFGLGVFNVESFSIDGNGGAIAASGESSVTLRGVRFRDNFASGSGGAISMMGNSRLFLRGTGRLSARGPGEFIGNRAGSLGGAISIVDNATGNVGHQVFSNNNAGVFGCDINLQSASNANFGNTLTLEHNTFAADCPNVLIENPQGRIRLRNNTFAGQGDALDTTDVVGVFGNLFGVMPSTNKVAGKAICNNFGIGNIVSEGYNIETTDSCTLDQPTDQINTDPMISAPDANGVVALMPNSPAIDAGASEITNPIQGKFGLPCGYRDARGLGRPQDANLDGVFECDIGNYEVQGGPDIGAPQSMAVFDPNRNGEGAFVEILPDGQAVVAEFTYRADGSGPAWLIGLGDVVGNSVVVGEMLQPVGGVFGAGFDPNAIDRQFVGSMSLVFSNCQSEGAAAGKQLFESTSDTPFEDLLVDAARLTTVVDCQNNASVQAGRSGSFFDVNRSGEGIFVQWLTSGQVVIIWYTFDPQGNQFWTISGATTVDGNTVTANMLYPASSTSFGSGFNPNEVNLQPWGTVTLQYMPGCNTMNFSYNSTVAGFGAGSYNYSRLTSLAGTTCDL